VQHFIIFLLLYFLFIILGNSQKALISIAIDISLWFINMNTNNRQLNTINKKINALFFWY